MQPFVVVSLAAIFAVTAASPALNATSGVQAGCTISSASEASTVIAHCKTISVGSFEVPAGQTLQLHLQAGTTLTFDGKLTFGYSEWSGTLIWITGDGVTVQGGSNHLIDGQGAKWWDGHGGHSSKKKPRVMTIRATGGSVFKNIKVRNCPMTCVGIGDSHDLTLENWIIDVKDGDTQGGINTDGFDVGRSSKVTIKDSTVWNQDDCISVNQGEHYLFENLVCTGGHGLSIGVGIWTEHSLNTVYNVTFQNCLVQNSKLGIHVKTIAGPQTGEITDVTYKNIKLSGITYEGVNVQQDYTNDGSTGHPMGNIKINQLKLSNVYGTVSGSGSRNVWILCGSGGCSNWNWNGVSISGGSNSNICNFAPSGFSC